MKQINWDDVQKIVLSGYGRLPYSAYILWRFLPGESAPRKPWLRELANRLTRVDANDQGASDEVGMPDDEALLSIQADRMHGKTRRAINLALTARGLERLEIGEEALNDFSREFREGMAPDAKTKGLRRPNVLGDLGASSPEHWDWGGWRDNIAPDGLLLLYATDEGALQRLIDYETKAMKDLAQPILELKGYIPGDRKEHFGFFDGISQPIIEGSPERRNCERRSAKQERISLVKPGEFLLGYENERHVRVAQRQHPSSSGPTAASDLRRNGTYLVFRQLEQDVAAFKDFVSTLALRLREPEQLAGARLIGRQASGEPLVPAPADAPKDSLRNDFLYHHEDRFGLACPIGAHVRRANPRDTIGSDPDTGLRLSKMHRIIRRGRPYGERWDPAKDENENKQAQRGMLFIALNADIAGQFEMIQHSWLNNPHFGGLYTGTDPLSHFVEEGECITFQRRPTNLHIKRPAPFVKVRGGAYFFLPGIQALQDMAEGPAIWENRVLSPVHTGELQRALKSMAREASARDGFPSFEAGAPWWGGHLQTVASALPTTSRRNLDQYPSERLFARVQDDTGDCLVATLHRPISSDMKRCLVLLIHGVSGSEDSSYILRSAVYFLNLGYPVLRANLRGAGPSRPFCKLQYNGGTTNDLVHLVSMVPADLRSNGIVAMGYSLGANVLMKFLGERGSSSPIRASVAVSSPLDLAAVSRRLMQWDNALFQFMILSQLRKESIKPASELSKRERDAVVSARTLWDFDETFTAPRNGFRGADDYYARSSCGQFLEHIEVPTLMIYALDDPIVPNDAYLQYRWDKNRRLIRLQSKSGGHCGFREADCHAYWHDVCAAQFLTKMAQI